MHKLKAAIAGILALFAAATAAAQTYPTVPSNTVIGRTAVGTGPAQAIPFSQLVALLLTPPFTISSINTNSVVYNGATSGTATVSAQAVAGTVVIKWPTTSGTVPTTATSPLVLNATTGNLSCPTCSGSITSVDGNVPSFSGTAGALQDSGNPASAQPITIGLLPAATPRTATITVTIASPGVITWTSHGQAANAPVVFTTSGALPTGITAGTTYYIVGSSITSNTFRIATSIVNAKAGTAINTSGSQSGTHTGVANGTIPTGYKGHIDEISVAAGAVSIPSATATNITTLSMPAGIYDCSGESVATTSGGALASEYHTTITTVVPPSIDTIPASGGGNGSHLLYIANNSAVFNFGPRRFYFTATTTVRLTLYATFGTNAGVGNNGAGALGAGGYLRCETK